MTATGIQLVRLVWQNHTTTAWATLNNSLYCALQVGISSGMRFKPQDFAEIESKYRPDFWLGEHGFERPYADAITYDNRSFIEAFEEWLRRKPFIANHVMPCAPYPKLIQRLGKRLRGRLAYWYEFGDGHSQPYRVTSIKGDVLIAVREAGAANKREVVKFTHDKLREMFPAPKKQKIAKAQ